MGGKRPEREATFSGLEKKVRRTANRLDPNFRPPPLPRYLRRLKIGFQKKFSNFGATDDMHFVVMDA